MGTLNYTLGSYGRVKGNGAATLMASRVVTSDAYTTSTSASNVENGSGDITARAGDVFRCVADEPMWIAFGGVAATVGNDHYLLADLVYEFEVTDSGTVSVIDVS